MPLFNVEWERRLEIVVEAATQEEAEKAARKADLDYDGWMVDDWDVTVWPVRLADVGRVNVDCGVWDGEVLALVDYKRAKAAHEEANGPAPEPEAPDLKTLCLFCHERPCRCATPTEKL